MEMFLIYSLARSDILPMKFIRKNQSSCE